MKIKYLENWKSPQNLQIKYHTTNNTTLVKKKSYVYYRNLIFNFCV